MASGKRPASLLLGILLVPFLTAPPALAQDDLIACVPEAIPCCLVPGEACTVPLLGEAAARVNDLAAEAGRFTDGLLGTMAQNLPQDEHSIVLWGKGQATVMVNGRSATCNGQSNFLLEASPKPLNLEPSSTFGYHGASQEGGFLLPCLLGQTRQPVMEDMTGSFSGAWMAERTQGSFYWRIEVSAPYDGLRDVFYYYTNLQGTQGGTFSGTLAEFR